jgi:putative spermidine/putrescine transport system permease protein
MVLKRAGRALLFTALGVYFGLPVAAVVLYSIATRWTTHILPDGYTLEHWLAAFDHPRMNAVTARTALLALVVTIFTVVFVVLAVYWQWVHNPRIRPLLELAAAIPFALPYVVIAFGILILSGQVAPFLQGTIGLVVLGHIGIAFPFAYWAIDSAMAAADVKSLHEAAQTCGAPTWDILLRVVLPNIGAGVASGAMLVFATSFGEFALVQILVGARFETISIYSLDLLSGTNAEFNRLAVLTVIMFFTTFAVSIASGMWNRGRVTQLLPGGIRLDKRA